MKKTIYIAIGTLIFGILIGWWMFGSSESKEETVHSHDLSKSTIWTCSMHPQIRKTEPGKCPICGMDLVPLKADHSEENPMEIKMSPTAMQLANVQTTVITKQKPVKELRLNGKVKADERAVYSQSSHIPGRIEKMMVSFTGERISKGQVLAYLYSPELVTAQEELFEAWKIRENQPQLYQAAREKLLNWKLTDKQIDKILEVGELQEQFPVLADVSGIVLNKFVNLGDYIGKGQPLFEVADLSKIWVMFDVYENDIPWIENGNEVTFTIHSFPGENFQGQITFVDPVIDPKTRVASARIEMNNPGMKFKPGMLAVGIVKSPVQNMNEELVVPKSSVMWTGKRSVVYIKHSDPSDIRFMMREITLGPSLGGSYIVKEGLEEGEEIAIHGTFSIDAAAQLAGKPSMMNPDGGQISAGHDHRDASASGFASMPRSENISASNNTKATLLALLNEYLSLKDALVADDFEKSKKVAISLIDKLNAINMEIFTGESHTIWMQHNSEVKKAVRAIEKARNIGEARQNFKKLSDHIIVLAITFGPFNKELFIQHCPMAYDNKGADWISSERQIQNPYFGTSMIDCGEVTKRIGK